MLLSDELAGMGWGMRDGPGPMSDGCWSIDMKGYRDTEERRARSGEPPRFQYADEGWWPWLDLDS